jgi:hypothetical protein
MKQREREREQIIVLNDTLRSSDGKNGPEQ